MPTNFTAEELGMSQEEYDYVPEATSKLDMLASRGQDKLNKLGSYTGDRSVVEQGALANHGKLSNDLSGDEFMGMVGTAYANEGLLIDEQGIYRNVDGQRHSYEGPATWLYMNPTKGEEEYVKPGVSNELNADSRYDSVKHPSWDMGTEGADTKSSENRMRLLLPTDTAYTLEALGKDRAAVQDNKLIEQLGRDEATRRFGGGKTEYFDNVQNYFGGSEPRENVNYDELYGRLKEYKKQVAPDGIGSKLEKDNTLAVDTDALLRGREGFKSSVYLDSLGNATAGYGHLLSEVEKRQYPVGTEIPQEQLDAWYAADTAKAEKAASSQLGRLNLPDEALPVLTSMNYQLGTGWIKEFPNTARAIRQGDYETAINNIAESKWAEQTPVRAQDAIDMLYSVANGGAERPKLAVGESIEEENRWANLIDAAQYGVGRKGAGVGDFILDGMVRLAKDGVKYATDMDEEEVTGNLLNNIEGSWLEGMFDNKGDFVGLDDYKNAVEYGYDDSNTKEVLLEVGEAYKEKDWMGVAEAVIKGVVTAGPEFLLESSGELAMAGLGPVGLFLNAGDYSNQIMEERLKNIDGDELSYGDRLVAVVGGTAMSYLNKLGADEMLGNTNAVKNALQVVKAYGTNEQAKSVAKQIVSTVAGAAATVVGKGTYEGLEEIAQEAVSIVAEKIGTKEAENILSDASGQRLVEGFAGGFAGGATASGTGIGMVGSLNTGKKAVEIVKGAIPKKEKAPVEPSEEVASSLGYAYNNFVANEETETVEVLVDKVKIVAESEELFRELAEGSYEKGIGRIADIAAVLGHAGIEIGELVSKAAKGLGVPVEQVESVVAIEYEKGKVLAAGDKKSTAMYRKADNYKKAEDRVNLGKAIVELRESAYYKEDSDFAEMVEGLVDVDVEETTDSSLAGVSEAAQKESVSNLEVGKIVKDAESRPEPYVYGSSEEAIDVIDGLLSKGAGKDRVEATVDKVASANGVSKETVESIRKSYKEVELEATESDKGYLAYGKMVDRLEGDAQLAILNKVKRFHTSQLNAVSSLKDMLKRAEVAKPGSKVVSTYKKDDGSYFDIYIGRNGKPVASQLANTNKLIALKEKNIQGIEKAVPILWDINKKSKARVAGGVDILVEYSEESDYVTAEDMAVSNIGEVPANRMAGGMSEVAMEQADVDEVTAKDMQADIDGKIPKPSTVAEKLVTTQAVTPKGKLTSEQAVEAIKYAMDGVVLNSEQDVVSGLILNYKISEATAKKIVSKAMDEEVTETSQPKEVMNSVLRNSLYKNKGTYLIHENGKPEFTVNEITRKKALAEVDRNPANYVKVGKETTLNTIPIDKMSSKVRQIVDSSINYLKQVVKEPDAQELNKGQKSFTSTNSPARALIFDVNGKVNDTVALALRAALVESVSFDKDMYSKSWKTFDDVAGMVGKESGEVGYELWSLVRDKGVMYDTVANRLGDKVASLLGINESKGASDIQSFARLKADLGAAAVHIGIAEGMLEFTKSADGKDGVAGEEFFEALGEEVTTEGARINFVSFVDESVANSKLNSKRAQVLKEAIPELDRERAKPYLSKVPKEVVRSRTTKVHKDELGIKPSKTHQDTLKRLMGTEWELDGELAAQVLDNKEAIMVHAGYIEESSERFKALSFDSQESQKGKNRKVVEDMEALEDMVKESGKGNDVSMWFEWYVTKNQRFMMASNTISPMNEKHYHRWLVQPKNMKLAYNVSKVGRGFKIKVDGKDITGAVRYALSQGLGLSVDKVSSKKIKEFGNDLLKLNGEQLADMKARLLKGEKVEFGSGKVAEVEHVGQMLLAMDFLEKAQIGGEFNSSLSAEFDAVTSGFGLKLMQMPIVKNMWSYLSKVGINVPSVTGVERTSMNDVLSVGKVLDSYKTLASKVNVSDVYGTFSSIESDLKDRKDRGSNIAKRVFASTKDLPNGKVWQSLKTVLPVTGTDEVSSELRSLFKDPFMTFNYSRSIDNIKQGLAGNIVSSLLDGMVANKNSEYSSLLRAAARVVTGNSDETSVTKLVSMLKNRSADTIMLKGRSVNLREYLESFVVATYGAEVARVFKDEFIEFIEAQETITDAFKYAYEVFNVKYEEEVRKLRKVNGRFNSDDKRVLVKNLMSVFPLVDGPASEEFKTNFEYQYLKHKESEVDGKFEDGSIAVYKTRNVAGGKDILATQFSAVDGVPNRNLNAKVRGVESTGVAGTVLPIHAIDAYVLANTYLADSNMQIVHDAIIPRLDVAMDSVKEYNKQVFEVSRNYGFVSSVKDMVDRVNTEARELGDLLDTEVGRKPIGGDKKSTLRELGQSAALRVAELSNKVQNSRSYMFNIMDEDLNTRVMHMASMEPGTYSVGDMQVSMAKSRVSTKKGPEEVIRSIRKENIDRGFTKHFSEEVSRKIDELFKCGR